VGIHGRVDEHNLAQVGSRVRIPSPAPVISISYMARASAVFLPGNTGVTVITRLSSRGRLGPTLVCGSRRCSRHAAVEPADSGGSFHSPISSFVSNSQSIAGVGTETFCSRGRRKELCASGQDWRFQRSFISSKLNTSLDAGLAVLSDVERRQCDQRF
jgi:hypothetical protein